MLLDDNDSKSQLTAKLTLPEESSFFLSFTVEMGEFFWMLIDFMDSLSISI